MFLKPLARLAFGVLAFRLLAGADVPPADNAAIHKLISAFETAENKHDEPAIASLFLNDSPDREAVSKRIASEGGVWTEKSPKRFQVDRIEIIPPGIALVDTTARWYQSGVMGETTRQMMVMVKDHGEWKISAYRPTGCQTGY